MQPDTTKPALPEPDEWACVLGVSQGIWTEPTVRAAIDAAVAEARAEIAKLKTVMIAAAEEIAAHWEAHCDAEGYGPQNLMRRLEEGIPSEYGYTAGAFAELKAKAEARAVPEGFTCIYANNFGPLADALERADRKGYMPDAMADEWSAFDWRIATTPSPTPPAEPETVPWPQVTRYSGGASREGIGGRVWIRLADDGPDVEYVPAPPARVALSDEQIIDIRDDHLPSQGESFDCIAFARAIETKHGITA